MATASEILKTYWGYDTFREPQEEIISAVVAGKPTLALLPTGGGKSICFQVPGLMLDGLCLVISPLIALMKDQVEQLRRRGIRAEALYAGMSQRELDVTLDNCIYGPVKFLYVSPERLQSSLFLARAEKMNFSMIAVDEAHCISQWGYDFRPPYLEINDFIKVFGIERKVALTATATKKVKADILEKLGMPDADVFTKSFARHNLSYSVFELESKFQKLLTVLRNVQGSALVYLRSRKRTQEIAEKLSRHQISASFYHAGLTGEEREKRQMDWINNQIRVMVATNAFGMGIDKPDVRSVIHLDIPDSLEAYYQEAGRAGRDGQMSYATLLFHRGDEKDLISRIEKSHVSIETIGRVYQALSNHYKLAIGSRVEGSFDFEVDRFSETYNLSVNDVYYSLKKLEEEGLMQLSDSFFQNSRLLFVLSKEDLYRFEIAHPQLERVIKGVLRLYGGEVFSEYMVVKESELAKLLNVSKGQIVKWLHDLAKYDVVDYKCFSNKQQLGFLTPRLNINALPIDRERLNHRKELAMQKAQAVVNYLRETKCRTRLLQSYFDELSDNNCGKCDYCLSVKRMGDTSLSPGSLLAFLKSEKKVSIADLSVQFQSEENEVLNTLRILVAEGWVKLVGEQAIYGKSSAR